MDDLIASSPLAWTVLHKFITENQKPLEFNNHRFLIDPMSDFSTDLVVKKSAQVGFSTLAILKSLWLCRYMQANVIYVLPTQNLMKDFVAPKVDPLIVSNPAISELISRDRENLKQVGERFLYFKGAASEREAIAISGDILILDEFDRMPDMNIVNTYDSRLQASTLGWRWRFSNPSQIGFGVDELYTDSDQMHWFIKCICGHESFLDFAPDTYRDITNHFVNQETKQYVCGKCGKEISKRQRINGRWVARYPSRKRRGYWISQLVAPWVSAERILEQKEESSIDFFYNFVLGKAYTPSDMLVNRETILRATAPSTIVKLNVVIGVDQNANEQIWVAGTPQGIFAHGKTESWEELENLKLTYNAIVVCDPAPYPTKPKQLARKYNDFYLCYFKEQKDASLLQWKENENVVYADRTRLLDTVANEITEARLLFRERPYELEDYIADWKNLYRTTEEKPDGRIVSTWMKKENKESDYSFATAYMRIGLSRVVNGSSEFLEPDYGKDGKVSDIITSEGKLQTDLSEIVKDTFADLE